MTHPVLTSQQGVSLLVLWVCVWFAWRAPAAACLSLAVLAILAPWALLVVLGAILAPWVQQ